MNWLGLLGVLLIAYAVFVLYVVVKKPAKLWGMKKIQSFLKVLGARGTVILFVVFGLVMGGLGVWLLLK